MDDYAEMLMDLMPDGWELDDESDPFGNLVCPCGDTIEQDGECPQGCISPLREMGLV